MNDRTIGFIGGGRVARIILEGWSRAGKMPARVTVVDPSRDALARLQARCPGIAVADLATAAAQDVVFLALPPAALPAALPAVRAALRPGALVVSLAPKFTVAALAAALGAPERVARVIPNGPSVIGAGFNPAYFPPGMPDDARRVVGDLLAPLGESPLVAEEKLEAYAVVTAMGPTYFWFQFQALREQAAAFGLDERETARALRRTVCGAARTLLESGLTPAEVMDLTPSKPLAEMEPVVAELFRTRLPAMLLKIKPPGPPAGDVGVTASFGA